MSNGYPFTSKRAVAEKISSDPAFALECVCLVEERRGWMASHKTRASKLVAKIAADHLSPEDLVEAVALASPYSRTISRVLRERELVERPELGGVAAVFGVVNETATEATTPVEAASAAVIDTIATEVSAAPLKRRPGRPKGAKNRKPRSEPEQPKRRRRS